MVKVIKYPNEEDWNLCKECTLCTVGKKTVNSPDFEWKEKILKSMHSPIRVLPFCFRLEIPYYISVHLSRHVHSVPFVMSQRNDRQSNYDRRKAPQDAMVTMCWYMNAEELINVAHKRLCRQADPDTRKIVKEMCDEVIRLCPEFKEVLVPNCKYRNGLCTEFFPCKEGNR